MHIAWPSERVGVIPSPSITLHLKDEESQSNVMLCWQLYFYQRLTSLSLPLPLILLIIWNHNMTLYHFILYYMIFSLHGVCHNWHPCSGWRSPRSLPDCHECHGRSFIFTANWRMFHQPVPVLRAFFDSSDGGYRREILSPAIHVSGSVTVFKEGAVKVI